VTTAVRDSLAAAESTAVLATASSMLTREDSMAIARAVSARMAQRTVPTAGATGVVAGATSRRDPRADSVLLIAMADSIRNVIQRAVLDSLVQMGARMGPIAVEIAGATRELQMAAEAQATMTREGGRMPPPPPGVRVGTPRRIVIAMPRPSRTRPEFDDLSRALADSLRRRIDANPKYVVVPADSVAAALRESRTVNGVQERLAADLIVSIALLPSRDSVVRLISVRDLAAPDWANHRTVASPVAASTAESGIGELVSQAIRALQEMERSSRQRPPGGATGGRQPPSFIRPAPAAAVPPVVPPQP
jgi:hypothetical protein